ncbi:MAG: hypothetical protein KDD84_12385 [Caldilineaceae bacterium]|nr:hypothetical protein [Caldilineaceae bacterium]
MKQVLAFLAVSIVWMGLAWGLLLSWAPVHAQEDWTRLDGPVLPGGPVMAVAASSAQSNTLYALVDHPFGVRLFRSAADTIAWTQVVTLSAEISPTLISSLFVDPGDGEVLYANNGSATLRSQDGGLSWTEILTAAGPMAVPAPSTVYVLHQIDSNENDDCSYERILARSDDAGNNWQVLSTPCLGEWGDLAVAPSDTNVIYLRAGATLFRSTDGGHLWQGNPTMGFTYGIAVNPTDEKHLLVSVFGDVLQSYDAGVSWSGISAPPFRVLASANEMQFAHDGTIYIAAQAFARTIGFDNTVPVIYRSEDKGKTWWLATELRPEFGMRLLVSPADSSTVFSWSRSRGVLRSPDQGNGWQEANDGILSPLLIQTIEPDGAGGLYVGASRFNQARNGLFHSADGGVTWRTILTDTQVQRVESAPNASFVFAIGNGKLYQGVTSLYESTELANVWVIDADISNADPNGLLVTGYRRATQYLDEGVVGIWYPADGNGGAAGWGISAIEGSVYVSAALIDPAQPTRMFAAAVMTDTLTTIFRSEDSGLNWQPISSPTTENGVPYRINRFYAAGSRIYAGGLSAIYSDDEGETWHLLSNRNARNYANNGTSLAVSNDGQVFAAGETDAYRWNVLLQDWERLYLPGGDAYALAIHNLDGEEALYVSNAQGLWKRSVPPAPIDSTWLPAIQNDSGRRDE